MKHSAATHRQVSGEDVVAEDCCHAARKAQVLLDLGAFGPRGVNLPCGDVSVLHQVLAVVKWAGIRTLKVGSR